MQVPRFSPRISLIKMAPRAALAAAALAALPCLSPAPHGTSSDWKNLPSIVTQTDTTVALIYKMQTLLLPPPMFNTKEFAKGLAKIGGNFY
jgi:hypothetical protein